MAGINRKKRAILVEWDTTFVVDNVKEVVSESDGKESKFSEFEGIFQKGNVPNGNRRIYKTELLKREVDKFQSVIKSGRSLGKGYHPGFFDKGGPSGLNDVTHRITELRMDGDLVKGKFILLKNKAADNAQSIVDAGGRFGISSRGYGSGTHHEKIVFNGKVYKDVVVIDDNYELATFDLVLTPSVKEALPTPTNESTDSDVNNVLENENENNNGGTITMTIEELKTQFPLTYTAVRDSAMKEGEDIGFEKGKVEAEKSLSDAIESHDKEVKDFKESETAKDEMISTLTKENEDLKTTIEKSESEKKAIKIKSAVIDSVSKSDFKKYFKDDDIVAIASVCDSVDAVADEMKARISIFESVIASYKEVNTPEDSGSLKRDTSEDGGSKSESDEDKNKAFAKSQRELAFG